MGVKNFFKIEEFKAQRVDFKSMSGTIAFDATAIVYTIIQACKLTDSDGNNTAHLNTVLNTQKLFSHMKQVWIFDWIPGFNKKFYVNAKTHDMKKEEREKRAKSSDRRVPVTVEIYEETMAMILALGHTLIVAPSGVDAEMLSIHYDYIFSPDSDVLLFGGRNLIRKNFRTKKYELYSLDQIHTIVTHNQLIEVGIALGTDYAPKVPRVGVKTVIKKVKAGLEFTDRQKQAIEIFKNPYSDKVKEWRIKPKVNKLSNKLSNELANWLVNWLVNIKNFNETRVKCLISNDNVVICDDDETKDFATVTSDDILNTAL